MFESTVDFSNVVDMRKDVFFLESKQYIEDADNMLFIYVKSGVAVC